MPKRSSVASSCMSCPWASSGFGTMGCWPIAIARQSSRAVVSPRLPRPLRAPHRGAFRDCPRCGCGQMVCIETLLPGKLARAPPHAAPRTITFNCCKGVSISLLMPWPLHCPIRQSNRVLAHAKLRRQHPSATICDYASEQVVRRSDRQIVVQQGISQPTRLDATLRQPSYQRMKRPPLRSSVAPVMYAASGEAR